MLDEQQTAAGAQHAPGLEQRGARVGDGAQCVCRDDRVHRGVGQVEVLHVADPDLNPILEAQGAQPGLGVVHPIPGLERDSCDHAASVTFEMYSECLLTKRLALRSVIRRKLDLKPVWPAAASPISASAYSQRSTLSLLDQ